MPEPANGYRVFRPGPQAAVFYVWDFIAFGAGIAFLVFLHTAWWHIVVGISMCLLGLWHFACTRTVLRTHFVVTDQQVLLVSPSCGIALRWDEIARVLVRQRPRGMQPGRADRAVMLTSHTGRNLVLNTSVLRRDEELLLLEEIRRRVKCPVETVTDGLFPGRDPGEPRT